jgi:ferritin-like protein
MRKRDIEKLTQLAALLRAAAGEIDTMIWYTERDAETKGYGWLTGALHNTARALIEIRKHYKQVAKSDTDWIMTDYGIKFESAKLVAWSRVVGILKTQGAL